MRMLTTALMLALLAGPAAPQEAGTPAGVEALYREALALTPLPHSGDMMRMMLWRHGA